MPAEMAAADAPIEEEPSAAATAARVWAYEEDGMANHTAATKICLFTSLEYSPFHP